MGKIFETIKSPSKRKQWKRMESSIWDKLPEDLRNQVIEKLPFKEVFRARRVCKAFRDVTNNPGFQAACAQSDRSQASYTPLVFFLVDGALEWMGFDTALQEWTKLPSLRTILPSPSRNHLKDFFLLTAGGGLLCGIASNKRNGEQIIVCNPLTRATKVLPPLHHARYPVLLHLLVDMKTNTYQVIAAGSACMGTESVSKKTEVFHSTTGEWAVTNDMPGPEYGLNEYQSGAYVNGVLFCLAMWEEGNFTSRAVLAYDVAEGEWLRDWRCPFPSCNYRYSTATNLQVLECDGNVCLFWEEARDRPQTSQFCFAKLNYEEGKWSEVVSFDRKECSTGLQCYPEYTCSDQESDTGSRVCVFNTILHNGEVYEAFQPDHEPVSLPDPSLINEGWETFHPLNPISFSFQPNFYVTV